jgi:ATP-dependent helicase/nuclease subunit A
MSISHTLVKASAGSGKTHHLSGHILSLLCKGEKPSRVLASTFTRKAAGEMFERVVHRLLNASRSDHALTTFMSEISLKEISLAREDIIEVLKRLIEEQSRTRISTLDSFFVSLGQAFFTEFNLPGTWNIADSWEALQIEEDSLEASIRSLGPESIKMLLSLITGSDNPSLIRTFLLREIRNLYQEFMDSHPSSWGSIENVSEQSDPTTIQEGLSYSSTEEIDGITPHKNAFKEAAKLLQMYSQNRWEDILSSAFTKRICIDEIYSYHNKPIPVPILEGVTHLTRLARSTFFENLQNKSKALAAILSEFQSHLFSISTQKGLFSFRELAHVLGLYANRVETQEMYYRLDSKISHILLDEFQDTSPLQWRILQPLASEILSKSGDDFSFLAVGDVKQAIYSWRGGTSELFTELEKDFPILAQTHISLNTTYRSYPGVISLVNKIFSTIRENSALESHTHAAEKWAKDFITHTSIKTTEKGTIKIKSLPVLFEEDNRRISSQEKDLYIKEELLKDLVPLIENNDCSSIGILTRTNTQARNLERFLTENGLSITGGGGELLGHARSTQLLISLLTFIEHPLDSFSYLHIMDSPFKEFLESLSATANYLEKSFTEELSYLLRLRLQSSGMSTFLRQMIHLLTPDLSKSEVEISSHCLRLTLGFERNGGSSIQDLIRILDNFILESDRTTKIKIMTYHKSKGLEFDAVFIPYTDDPFFASQKLFLLKNQESPLEPPKEIIMNCKKEARVHFPELQKMFSQWTTTQTMEGLCMTYVLLTRAVHSLFIYLIPSENSIHPTEGNTGTSTNLAKLLRGTFGFEENLAPGIELFSLVAPLDNHEKENLAKELKPVNASIGQDPLSPPALFSIPEYALKKNLQRKYPSAQEISAVERIQDALEKAQKTGSSFGSEVHSILQHIRWLETPPSNEILHTLLSDHNKALIKNTSIIPYLTSALSNPSIYKLFNKNSFLSKTKTSILLETELPFSLIENRSLLSGRVDRLVLTKASLSDIHFNSAYIIDFKTGKNISPSFLESQGAAYQKFVSKKYSLAPDKIRTLFPFLSTGEVIEIKNSVLYTSIEKD